MASWGWRVGRPRCRGQDRRPYEWCPLFSRFLLGHLGRPPVNWLFVPAPPEGSALITPDNRLGPRSRERAWASERSFPSVKGSPYAAERGRWEESTAWGRASCGPLTKPQLGKGGGGGGRRKGVLWRGTQILYNEPLSSMNRGLSSTRPQWLCF